MPRIAIRATVPGVLDRDALAERARGIGALGWVRADDGVTRVHAEGNAGAVDELATHLGPGAEIACVNVEGHEQFAVRGVPAGAFVVVEASPRFELRLEVGGVMRAWGVPKAPSMDPAVKRFAVAAGERPAGDAPDSVWDRGLYEQGGRVPWPEAIDRGHAVFVLHGAKLRGGFALQRTPRGWLLVKRRDEYAQPGGG